VARTRRVAYLMTCGETGTARTMCWKRCAS